MTPFFFGSDERRLFGIYEPPSCGNSAGRSVVLCYPFGSEYVYAHRAMRQLALKLCHAGFHTLRFDFFGTGDSGGESHEVDFESLEFDVRLAIQEIKDMSGLNFTSLVGLRLGGSVAASVATKCHDVIDSLVLWDPIVSGKKYLTQMGLDSNAESLPKSSDPLFTNKMFLQLQQFDLFSFLSENLSSSLVLVTESVKCPGLLTAAASNVEVDFVNDVSPWVESSIVTGRVPVTALNRITSWLHG
jgi:pimeloyl-ACP methyl ester carboxylesterase